MNIIDIILIGISLSMDAFVLAVCKGIEINYKNYGYFLKLAFCFGFFQFLMPIIGYLFGRSILGYIVKLNYFFVVIIFLYMGINMIIDFFSKKERKINYGNLLSMSLACSIDALVVGVSFAFLNENVLIDSFIIGVITFLFSLVGINIGYKFGVHYKKVALLFGGFLLVTLALKTLIMRLI